MPDSVLMKKLASKLVYMDLWFQITSDILSWKRA